MADEKNISAKKPRLWNPALDDSRDDQTEPTKTPVPAANPPIAPPCPPLNLLFQNYAQLAGPYIARLQADSVAVSLLRQPRCHAEALRMAHPMLSDCKMNPLVMNALGSVPSPNQNCCAMCGSAFRLTSDLVQHMRINHRSAKFERSRKRTH